MSQADLARRLYPPDARAAEPEPIHGETLLPTPEPGRDLPYVGINMVASVDGRVRLGTSAIGLGSAVDQRLLRRLRAEADVVMHGAATLRADRFTPRVPADLAEARHRRGLPDQPAGALVTGSGSLPADHPYLATATPDWPRLLYTTSMSAGLLARPGVEVTVLPGDRLDLREVLLDLGRHGYRRVVAEGGPHVNAQLLAAGLVDDLFLTLAPKIVGGEDPLTIVAGLLPATTQLTLASLFERDGELFLRYAVQR